jgi:small subunit ribosomal protein S19
MARSLRKPPFVNPYLLSELVTDRPINLWARNSFILPKFVHKVFRIHNGKGFKRMKITEQMVGSKFGEYAPTRQANIYKKKQKKK